MNFLVIVIAFLLGGVTVIGLEIFGVRSFLNALQEFLTMPV